MKDLDKKEIKEVIEWCDEKGHSEHEILELIRRIVGAKPKDKECKNMDRDLNDNNIFGVINSISSYIINNKRAICTPLINRRNTPDNVHVEF